MKNKIIILCCFCLLSINIFAQWRIKGGIDLSSAHSTVSSSDIGGYMPGFHIGMDYDISLSKKFFFQPGLLFCTNGFKFETSETIKKAEVKMYALEVPLIMSFRPLLCNSTKLLTEFGLYARYNLFGNKDYQYVSSPSVKGSPFDAYNRFDSGLHFGIGFLYSGFFLAGEYQIGLTNLEKNINGIQHRKIRISVGYMF